MALVGSYNGSSGEADGGHRSTMLFAMGSFEGDQNPLLMAVMP